jgi:hypothetical protein
MVAITRYEVRYHEKEDWQEISDVEMMEGLYKIYNRVTPAIKQMIKGKELRTPDAVYRLKWIGRGSRTVIV